MSSKSSCERIVLSNCHAYCLFSKVQIWVRRAGPNYQEGLKSIKAGELLHSLAALDSHDHRSAVLIR